MEKIEKNKSAVMKDKSNLMKFAHKFLGESFAWSLRRFYVPVSKNDLVLEVGSGGNPYGRSNVLIDGYMETRERHWVPLVSDRPTVIGFVENLPFKDNSFDFSIASHVLEHSKDPSKFLSEIQRVSKSGYIEVPDAFMERINPYKDHRLEITVREGTLMITKKRDWVEDQHLVELYEDRVKDFLTKELMSSRPFAFHTRFYWTENIKFKITNPEVSCDWPSFEDDSSVIPARGIKAALREAILLLFRKLTSQTSRNRKLDIQSLLQCPRCRKSGLKKIEDKQVCDNCLASFKIIKDIPILTVDGE